MSIFLEQNCSVRERQPSAARFSCRTHSGESDVLQKMTNCTHYRAPWRTTAEIETACAKCQPWRVRRWRHRLKVSPTARCKWYGRHCRKLLDVILESGLPVLLLYLLTSPSSVAPSEQRFRGSYINNCNHTLTECQLKNLWVAQTKTNFQNSRGWLMQGGKPSASESIRCDVTTA